MFMLHHSTDHGIYSSVSKKLTIAMNRKLRNAIRTKIFQRFPQKIYERPPVKKIYLLAYRVPRPHLKISEVIIGKLTAV